MESVTPKKPLTPFFMFREKEKEKGNAMSGKEAGEKWQSLNEEEKKPYIEEYREAREKYDAYLESEGITPKKSSMRKSGIPAAYRGNRIRSMLGMCEEVKSLHLKQCSALGQVAQEFVKNLGKSINDRLKKDDKRVVTLEVVTDVLENLKAYSFIVEMSEYQQALEEIDEEALAHKKAKEKARKAKEKAEKEEEVVEEKPKKKSEAPKKSGTARKSKRC